MSPEIIRKETKVEDGKPALETELGNKDESIRNTALSMPLKSSLEDKSSIKINLNAPKHVEKIQSIELSPGVMTPKLTEKEDKK